MRYLLAVALLLAAAPAQAQAERLRPETELPALAQAAPGLDADGCIVCETSLKQVQKEWGFLRHTAARKDAPTGGNNSFRRRVYCRGPGWFDLEMRFSDIFSMAKSV